MGPLALALCYIYQGAGQHNRNLDWVAEVIALIEKSGRESDFFHTAFNVYSGFADIMVGVKAI